MDREALIKARDTAGARFDELEKLRVDAATNISEQNRLKGVYQTYQQLIDQLDAKANAVPEGVVVPKVMEATHAENNAE